MSQSRLANLPEITEICKYALYTDYIDLDIEHKETALSLMLVAPPEGGKTAVVTQFNGNRGLLYIDNATAWGIEHTYLKELKEGTIKRIIIPDFIDPTNRKKATVDSTVIFFNKYISWEGIREVQTYGMSFSLLEPVRGSLLTTMATEDFNRLVKSLVAVGFLSRIMLVAYKYAVEELEELLRDITYKRAKWCKIELPLPDGKIAVELDPDLAIRMNPLAIELGQRVGGGGIRAYHQLSVMAKGKALSEGRMAVTDDDIHRVMYLAERYVNNIEFPRKVKKALQEVEKVVATTRG